MAVQQFTEKDMWGMPPSDCAMFQIGGTPVMRELMLQAADDEVLGVGLGSCAFQGRGIHQRLICCIRADPPLGSVCAVQQVCCRRWTHLRYVSGLRIYIPLHR
jgi:hypothetical protein